MRNADCGVRNGRAGHGARLHHSAFRIPHSALLIIGLLPTTGASQQWPIHSLDRPRPPVVDPGPERPPAPPPADAVVLFDGSGLGEWEGANGGGAARWRVQDGYMEVVGGTGSPANPIARCSRPTN